MQSDISLLGVECIPTEEIIKVVIKPYSYGMAPVVVFNYLNNVPIVIYENLNEKLDKDLLHC
jgi:hypothetical protein